MSDKTITIPPGPFEPTWESLENYTIPEWFKDAKFGIFIHWGVYSVPAFGNEWYPRNMYLPRSKEFEHHVATYGPQSEFGYKDFIPMLTAEHFDPNEWADLFQQAGAKFVVPVAEHHDGFPMYDTALSEWSAAKMGPKRDIVGELAEATRARDMVFGVSSHRAEHWWFFDGGRYFDSDVNDPQNDGLYGPARPAHTRPNEAFLNDWLARICELIDKYQPQVIWFDWWIEQPAFKNYLQRFAAYYYNRAAEWNRGVVVQYKHEAFPEKVAVLDIERGQLSDIRPLTWQTDTAVAKNSWGYVESRDYKQAGDLIGDLVDIVSKNGILLLNIGPRPDGTIPEGDAQLLREIGKWLAVNGEAIYNTRPWTIYGEGPTQVVGGEFNDTSRQSFTAEDVRFTTNGDTLYATIFGWPEGELTIRALGENAGHYDGSIGNVELIGSSEPVQWSQDDSGLHVTMPSQQFGEHAFVLKITR
jgi:alpha-L-fucosidase